MMPAVSTARASASGLRSDRIRVSIAAGVFTFVTFSTTGVLVESRARAR